EQEPSSGAVVPVPPQPPPVRLEIATAGMTPSYPNFFPVPGTFEELPLDFGVPTGLGAGGTAGPAKINHRLVIDLAPPQPPPGGPRGGDPASRTDVRPGRDGPAEACAATMNNDPPKIYIVGIGGDGLAGLTSRARELVAGAEILVGSDAALRLLPEVNAERVR